MAATTSEVAPTRTFVDLAKPADPAPLGLAAFALTTFILSGHDATFIVSKSFAADLTGANLPNAVA